MVLNISCNDEEEIASYHYMDPDSIIIDSVTMLNIIGKWHLITMEDTINNIVAVDSNKALVFLENGNYGIETNGVIELKENYYHKITYSSIYYINKQTNTIDSMRNISYDEEKDRLGFEYEIPPDESTFGCTYAIMKYRIEYYKRMEEKE